MKCPKCGYNSFEFLDNCKKCKHDLSAFKQSLGINFPAISPVAESAAPPAAATVAASLAAAAAPATAAAEETFTWDEPATAPAPANHGDDIFSSMDLDFAPAPAPAQAQAAPPPVSFDMDSPMAATPAAPPAASEAELPDFSFDEPADAAPAEPPTASFGSPPASEDDFASLLEIGDNSEETAAAAAPVATPELESAWETPANVFGSIDEGQSAPPAADAGEAGEFQLENFSWEEETPNAPQPPPKGPHVELPSDLDALFGEPDKP
ncbi:hypothetical protein [Geobacter benzoatilyticus]|jgi:hypothetical protein|uniref:Uncharacterized protein n=1 Tax=Geobacter benzoatilyticus TaxID=2815309 RepID=A0ABX7Q776_9BACT|nr:hypothetical protein [Geobacter benzoatilyticus]QSV46925.1 hypothetical protein JZM60_06575 [Geobacter benzoatilyticus]